MNTLRLSRSTIAWFAIVVAMYVAFTLVASAHQNPRIDVAMIMANNLAHGDASLDEPPGRLDTVTRDGRAYHVVGIGPILPSLPFVPVAALWPASRWITSLLVGLLAAGLAWPLAARYGPGGAATPWLATLGAAGTLLLPLATQGNFYYLAHLEATACLFAALVEWAGRRRGWVAGTFMGLAALARPTTLLATIPFALVLLVDRERRARGFAGFAVPVAAAVGVIGLYNLVRFGSPLESGYGLAILQSEALIAARQAGVFSLRHVGDNLAILVGGGFDTRARFPYLIPSRAGHSILLTSPALLAAVNAGFRDRTAQVLWAAAVLVLVPLLLYYGGGGFATYGYRYIMDVVPFLLALVAMGARRQFGGTEKILIVLSVAFCVYGAAWGAANGHF